MYQSRSILTWFPQNFENEFIWLFAKKILIHLTFCPKQIQIHLTFCPKNENKFIWLCAQKHTFSSDSPKTYYFIWLFFHLTAFFATDLPNLSQNEFFQCPFVISFVKISWGYAGVPTWYTSRWERYKICNVDARALYMHSQEGGGVGYDFQAMGLNAGCTRVGAY